MDSTPTNPICYSCKHRGMVPGSVHSTCQHPRADIVDVLLGRNPLEIQAVAHGVRQGWFSWPIDFDPRWLTQCNGYEARSEVNNGPTEMAKGEN